MGMLDRIKRLELKYRNHTFDNDNDGFIFALLGDRIEEYKSEYYGQDGWDSIGILNELAKEDWKGGNKNV